MEYGYFASGKRLRYFEEERDGVLLLRAELPEKGKIQRYQRKALSFFRRAGIRLLLNGENWMERYGVSIVETGNLYRKKGAEIALMVMEQQGLSPLKTVVGLRGSRWTREMELTCDALAGRVYSIAIALPDGLQEDVVWSIQQKYGLSVPTGDGDITLCFSSAEEREGRILLGERRPMVEGIRFGEDYDGLPWDAAEGLAAVQMP